MTRDNHALHEFIRTHFVPEDDHDRSTQQRSLAYDLPEISVSAEEGQFLRLMAAASGGESAVEIGTLGGYSARWIMRGLAPDGKLITIDISEKHAEVARENLARAGLTDRIEFLTGEALEILPTITARGPFDFVFIDADKDSYPDYYAWAVENVRAGGVICAHNAFRGGRITEKGENGEIGAFVDFLKAVAADERVVSTIYPTGDGTLVAVRK